MTKKNKILISVSALTIAVIIIFVILLVGCQNTNKTTSTPDEISVTTSSGETTAPTSEESTTITDKVIAEQGLTVNANGEVVDNEGNKVEKNEDGTYTVKTETGETVKVTAEDVKKAPVNNTNTNTGTNNKPANNTNSTTSKVDNNTSDKPVNSNTNTDNKKPDTNTSSNANSNTSIKTWHEAEYKYVEHPAETKTEQVWVVDKEAYTYEEPVYEKTGVAICNTCGADITNSIADHGYNHMINGENASYHTEERKVIVDYETITVPEEGHWETKTIVIKEAWTEKVLVREAGYY